MLYDDPVMKRDNALIQIKKGALEFCVLAVIARGERYGYEIVKILGEYGPSSTVNRQKRAILKQRIHI